MARRGTGTEIQATVKDAASAKLKSIADAVATEAAKIAKSDDKLAVSAEQARKAKNAQLTATQKLKGAMEKEAAAGDPVATQLAQLSTLYRKATRQARAYAVAGEEVPPALISAAVEANKTAKALKNLGDETEESTGKFKKLRDKVSGFSISYKAMGLAIFGAATVAAAGTAKLVLDTAELGDRIAKTARRMGISVEAYQAFDHAMNVSGTSMVEQGEALAKLARKVRDASEEVGTGKAAFDRLGISVRNSAGEVKSSEQVFLDVAQAFHDLPDGVDKAAISMDLFEESGTKLIEFLNLGSVGIATLRDEAEDLGIMLGEDDTTAAEEFTDSLDRLMKSGRGLNTSFGKTIMPAMTELANFLTSLVKKFRASEGSMVRFITNGIELAADFSLGFMEAFTTISNSAAGLDYVFSRAFVAWGSGLRDLLDILNFFSGSLGDALVMLGVFDTNPFGNWSRDLDTFIKEQEQAMEESGNRIIDNNDKLAEAKVAVNQLKGAMTRVIDAEKQTAEAIDETTGANKRRFKSIALTSAQQASAARAEERAEEKRQRDIEREIKQNDAAFQKEKRNQEKMRREIEKTAKARAKANDDNLAATEKAFRKISGPVHDAFQALGANVNDIGQAFKEMAKVGIGAVLSMVEQQVMAFAVLSAAEAFSSQAAIPIIGPILGAVAAMAALGFVRGLLSMMNKGGIVPGTGNKDEFPALLTPGEIVLPKALSEKILQVVGQPAGSMAAAGGVVPSNSGGGGGGGGVTVNITENMLSPRTPGQLDKFVKDQLMPSLNRLKRRGFAT